MDKNGQTQGSFVASPGSPKQNTASSNDTFYNFTNTKGFPGAQHYFSSAKVNKLKAKALTKQNFSPTGQESGEISDLKN